MQLSEQEKERMEFLEGTFKDPIREKAFALAFITEGGNAYQAALSAGYSKNTAKNANVWINETLINDDKKRRLPFKPALKEYISLKGKELAPDKVADAEEVLEFLTSVVRGEAQEDTVVMKGTGVGMTEAEHINKTPSIKDQLRAAEILAKIMGMQKTNVNVTGITPIIIGGEDQLEE